MPQNEGTITLIKGDSVGIETDYRDALPVNMTGIVRAVLGAQGYMIETPGLSSFGLGVDVDRGGIWNERLLNHYRVSGGKLIEVSSAGASTVLGDISGLDTVSLPYSFNTQGIVADGRFWLYDPVGGFVEVVDPDLGDPIDCVWIDGYYFFTDGENLYHTDLVSETAIDPLKFATSEFSPDPTLGVGKTVDNKVIAFNRYSTEYFANVASENFAFTRIPNRALKTGIVGTHAKVEIDDEWYILGGRKNEDISVHVIGTGTSTEVSSREVDKILKQYSEDELSTTVFEKRMLDDYLYLIIHLPQQTLMLNVSLGKQIGYDLAWSILTTGVSLGLWRGKHGVWDPRLGSYVYGDKQGALLGLLDNAICTQYDEIQEWYLYTPFLDLETMSLDEVKIETIPGFTAIDDATVFLALTYDGVHYGMEVSIDYGGPSEYGKQWRARRLGNITDWVGIRLRGTSRSRMAFGLMKIFYG